MDQISLPMRIALAVSLVFAALWFVALRPKPVADVDGPLPTPAAAKPAEGITGAPGKAADAVAGSNAAQQGRADAADATGSAPAAPAGVGVPVAKPDAAAAAGTSKPPAKADARKPAAADKTASKPRTGPKAVLADVTAGKTVVLLFWDPKASSSDDRAVRRAVSDVDRRGGAVKVHLAELDKLAGYEPITKAAPVHQTPTVLVIDRAAKAHVIKGLTVTREIDSLVDRVLDVERAPK